MYPKWQRVREIEKLFEGYCTRHSWLKNMSAFACERETREVKLYVGSSLCTWEIIIAFWVARIVSYLIFKRHWTREKNNQPQQKKRENQTAKLDWFLQREIFFWMERKKGTKKTWNVKMCQSRKTNFFMSAKSQKKNAAIKLRFFLIWSRWSCCIRGFSCQVKWTGAGEMGCLLAALSLIPCCREGGRVGSPKGKICLAWLHRPSPPPRSLAHSIGRLGADGQNSRLRRR